MCGKITEGNFNPDTSLRAWCRVILEQTVVRRAEEQKVRGWEDEKSRKQHTPISTAFFHLVFTPNAELRTLNCPAGALPNASECKPQERNERVCGGYPDIMLILMEDPGLTKSKRWADRIWIKRNGRSIALSTIVMAFYSIPSMRTGDYTAKLPCRWSGNH
jgi:hypothetical protein